MIAQKYPAIGSVVVLQAHESAGPTGWHGNYHNGAVGWYWFQALPNTVPPVRSATVFKQRSDAEADAVSQFPNITGWSGRPKYKIAEVSPT